MMRKVLIIVGIAVIAIAMTIGAFGGGFAVGRLTANAKAPAAPSPSVTLEAATPEETVAPPSTSAPPTPRTPVVPASDDFDYQILQDVLKLLDQQFYGEIPDGKTLAYGAIRGMLLTLDDPYTSFIDPQVSAILNEDASGTFEGIGAMVNMRDDGYLEIASLIPGQPAEAAGVLPGDIILAVGDQSIVGLGLYEAISYIRGPAGTEAVLKIARPDVEEPIIITVVRAKIEVPVVDYKMLENDIAYVRLTEFDANAADKVNDALKELLAKKPKGLIFDLRANPGGWLDQAIKVSDIFLGKGLVAIERDSSGGEQRFYSYNGDLGEDIPMVVLVNAGSASASEIVAGALQDRERAVLIGTKTLGKGSVQRPNDLQDGSQLRVTIARWFTPKDKSIHGDGLEPDIEVEYPRDTPVGEDPQLDRAVEYLRSGN
ncbi:MAG TPA: S41 family peptidase [Anaerolineae bacterium]|nr:S41 family peptidase [Anaerolineae bacterium]HQI83761.1 S41 family peptidase [Anaerolineae bacterium]